MTNILSPHHDMWVSAMIAQYVKCRLDNYNLDEMTLQLEALGYTQDDLDILFIKETMTDNTITNTSEFHAIIDTCNVVN